MNRIELIQQAAGPLPPFIRDLRDAVRLGGKTQTRRIIKPQPEFSRGYWHWRENSSSGIGGCNGDEARFFELLAKSSPYGKAEQIRYLREPIYKGPGGFAHYVDDDAMVWDGLTGQRVEWRWKPKTLSQLYMPKEMARTFVRMDGIRPEQLQSISETDAVAEGVAANWCGPLDGWEPDEHGYMDYSLPDDWDGEGAVFLLAKESYKTLWDKINAKRGYPWAGNWWVWVLVFGLIGGENGN